MDSRRKGKKTRLRLTAARKKQRNILKYNASRRAGLPCLTKNILHAQDSIIDNSMDETLMEAGPSNVPPQEENILNDSQKNVNVMEAGPSNILQCNESRLKNIKLEGYRIVNLQNFFDQLVKLTNHSPLECTLKNLFITHERRLGFQSVLSIECDLCGLKTKISTCPERPSLVDINTAAVAGIVNIGGGLTHLKNLTSAMEIPSISSTLYKSIHTKLCTAWEDTAWQSMKEAAAEESRIAIDAGSVDSNGVPMITVVCDGSWAKRSYRGGGNYNSLSGVAAIVGLATGKILYLGVKNKYCIVCQRYENKQQEIKDHTCYRNWSGTSTSMEASIISEGFSKSLEMYNVIYHQMIADGDSSCYKSVVDSRPYKNCTVQKIECRNHLLRNFCNKIRDLTKMTGIPGILKNVILSRIIKIRSSIMKAVLYRKTEDGQTREQRIINLRNDILNSVSHIFGEHEKCSSLKYFCRKSEPDSTNYVNDFKLCNIHEKMMDIVRYLAGHSRSLLENVDTNLVEQFNSMIAQKIGGKRINYSLKQSYRGRCFAAVVSKNTKKPLSTIHKYITGRSPGKILKTNEERNQKRNLKKRRSKKRLFTVAKHSADHYYGPDCQKPDMDYATFEDFKNTFLQKTLIKNEKEYLIIEEKTRLQSDSAEWKEYRKQLLTSSYFGKVCRMLVKTSCASIVENILYKEPFSKAIAWGRNNELRAKENFKALNNLEVYECGLLINKKWPYLGSSPDGITNLNDLIEIKCPFSARNFTVLEGIENKLIKYLYLDSNNYKLKKTHPFFYQIQGQLNIWSKNKCHLVVWTLKDCVTIEILKDENFFENTMIPKLEKFYFNCLLPEIIDPRHTRGMNIRDPDYILNAQNKTNK